MDGKSECLQFVKISWQEKEACGDTRKLTQDYQFTWNDP